LDDWLAQSFFAWLPAWSFPSTLPANLAQYPPSVLLITFVVGLAFNGVAAPLVEELYFRGYLLPRIPSSRRWAPLINVLLFSLCHFFSPWQNLTRIVALIPLVYAVSWKRNIYLSIFTHCILNTLGMLSTFALVAQ
jgi:membrane protease YdiL (CAAX protease family)